MSFGIANVRRRWLLALALSQLIGSAPAGAATRMSDLHTQALKFVDQSSASYIETSRRIWEHPQLGYQEVQSSAALQAALRKDGFTVTSPVADEPTGFIASYGEGKPVIGLLGEFDALPGLSQDAVPERKPLSEDGTPAEEGGSGKVYMLRAGLFKDTDVVLQWHPADHNAVSSGGMLAIVSAKFIFHGVAAHAAMAEGRKPPLDYRH